jgi:hypothetical protein
MQKYKITFVYQTQSNGPTVDIPKITRAATRDAALVQARDLFAVENPDLDSAKITSWHRERLYF